YKHAPSCFLRHANRAVQFPTAIAVLAVRQHPHRTKPLVKSNRRVLENRPDLDAELTLRVTSLALPHTARSHEGYVLRTTPRADNSVRPAARNQVVQAVVLVGEVNNGLLKRLG